MSRCTERLQCSIPSLSAVHQVANATRVQVPRNVRFLQRQGMLAKTALFPPGGRRLERKIRGRVTRQDGGQEKKAHQEAESSEQGL